MQKRDIGQSVLTFTAAAAVVGAFAAVVWLFALAIREGATVVAAILASLATVSAAVIARYFERKKELEAARRQHLGPLYEQLAAPLAGHELTPRKLEKTLREYTRKSLIYASPTELAAWRAWRDNMPDDDAPRHVQRASALRMRRSSRRCGGTWG